MHKLISFLLLFLILSMAATSWGDDYCVDPSGSWTGGTGPNCLSVDTTIGAGMGRLASGGGDTLWIRNGTYTGAGNLIDSTRHSLNAGAPGSYNIIRAETDFGVTIDMRDGVDYRGWIGTGTSGGSVNYIMVRGIVFRGAADSAVCNGNQACPAMCFRNTIGNILYRCAVYDGNLDYSSGGGDPNDSNAFQLSYASYSLIEECVFFGAGHYTALTYSSDHSVWRKCIARHDVSHGGAHAAFQNYESTHTSYQSCIAIDFDEWQHMHENGDYLWGGFGTNGASTDNIEYLGCVAVNMKGPGANQIRTCDGTLSSPSYQSGFFLSGGNGSRTLSNCVVIGAPIAVMSYQTTTIDNATFADINEEPILDYADGSIVVSVAGNPPTVTDTIFYDGTIGGDTIGAGSNFNLFNALTTNCIGGCPGENNVTYSPASNGLLYPTRIESGSNLATAGSGEGRLGADLTYVYGRSMSLWGDSGYNARQDGTNGEPTEKMWPFPNEDTIHTLLSSYTMTDTCASPPKDVNGDRGFAVAGQTLTKYIWEWMGNTIPSDIYGVDPPSVPSAPINLHVVSD